jgi:hypothetical protein
VVVVVVVVAAAVACVRLCMCKLLNQRKQAKLQWLHN